MSEPMRRPRVGEIIVYKLFSGSIRRCLVTAVHDNIKNGQRGFDGYRTGTSPLPVWGYDHQIVEWPQKEVEVE